ncbi:MAG: hypothetical protein NXI04_13645 [Planctomycetaceae bacterium]|nr:hypothetical protein [Planctomycetaceae bacterium]
MRKAIRQLLRNCIQNPRRRGRPCRPVARQLRQHHDAEILENRTLLAAQLVASDATEKTIAAGQTFEVPVFYQTLDDSDQPAELQANVLSFNLHFDATELNYISTSFQTTEGLQIAPTETRPESDPTVVGDDNDAETDTVLVASYTDTDPALNFGWPNAPQTDPLPLFTVTFTARNSFDGSKLNFSVNQTGNVIGQTAEFDFRSESVNLNFDAPPPPTISIEPAESVVEGQPSEFAVTLSEVSTEEITVQFATANGTGSNPALAGEDYEAVAGQTLVFAPGETQKTISITTIDDPQDELDESFSVSLSNPVGATLAVSTANGTIADNDTAITLNVVENIDVTEGELASFQVTLTNPAPRPVNVTYSTVDGGPSSSPTTVAVDGQDYTGATSETVTIPTGQSSINIQIPTINDTILEPSEYFELIVTSDPDVILGNARSEARILDNDAPPDVSFSVSDAVAVTEGGDLIFTVSLDGAPSTNVTVNYRAEGSGPESATEGADFQATSGTLTFTPDGPLSQTITVPTIDDVETEFTEGIQLRLSDSVGAVIDRSVGFSVIEDNEGQGESATIEGRKWNDSNGNGQLDPGEGFLNGWTIQLYNADGVNIGTTVTADRDLNNDNQIDSATEVGWYSFTVSPGSYTVFEVQQDGWRQTSPDTPLEALAYELDTTLELRSTVFDFFDWGGRQEKWMLSPQGWFFMTPDGTLWEWDGSGRDNLTGTETAVLSPEYYEDLALLYDAPFAEIITYTLADGETATANFGNVSLVAQGQIQGRKWNDLNADGVRDNNEPWLNGWVVELVNASGSVVDTTTTADIDLNADGQIDPATETGVYQFLNVDAAEYVVREVQQDGWRQTAPGGPAQIQAWELDQQYNLTTGENLFENWGGLQERWMRGTDNWFFIVPSGEFFAWNGSPRSNLSGDLLAQLPPEYYTNPTLLSEAENPFEIRLQVQPGQFYGGLNFGNTELEPGGGGPGDGGGPGGGGGDGGGNGGGTGGGDGITFAGAGDVNVRVIGNSLFINGDTANNGILINTNDDGWITVSGLGDTTIVGGSQFVVEGWTSIPGDLHVNLASGSDAVVIQGVDVDRSMYIVAGGDDYFVADDLSVSILADYRATNAGNNTFAVTNSQFGNLFRVNTFGGNDSVYVNSTTVTGVTIFNGRGGNDVFAVQDTSFGTDVVYDAGTGNDTMVTEGTTAVGRRLYAYGRSGNDAYNMSAGTSHGISPIITGFEADSIADPGAIIDQIMSQLADVGL